MTVAEAFRTPLHAEKYGGRECLGREHVHGASLG